MKKVWSYIDYRLILGVTGIFLSVLLHELFHIVMHWNEVVRVGLFSNPNAIAEVMVRVPHGYDLEGEEIAAYIITLLVLLTTIALISRIHDKKDPRSFSETFLVHKDLKHLEPSELIELTQRANLLKTHH